MLNINLNELYFVLQILYYRKSGSASASVSERKQSVEIKQENVELSEIVVKEEEDSWKLNDFYIKGHYLHRT